MNGSPASSGLTCAAEDRWHRLLRPRLEFAFTGHGFPPIEPGGTFSAPGSLEMAPIGDPHRPMGAISVFFACVSAAVASEAATGSFDEFSQGPERVSAFESAVAEAFDVDIATWTAKAQQSSSADLRGVVRLLKIWSKPSGESKRALVSHVLDAALDPLTWYTAHRDVGPRPNISVRLLLPGSLAHSTTVKPLADIDIALIFRGGSHAGADLSRLADAMTPDVAVPSPALVLQARRNAQARTELLTEFGALTASQVAELSGSEAKNRSALAGRWRREGRVLAVEHHGSTYYPAFQFDAHGRPHPAIADVLKHLNAPSMTAWQQTLWFTTANGWLDGRRPVDLLESEPTAVVAAARDALREPVG